MTAVTYIARRSLSAGHFASTEYSLDLQCLRDGLVPKRDVRRNVIEPLSRRGAEILRYDGRREFDVTLAPLTGLALDLVVEFLDSCEEHTFTFDPYGAVGSPAAPFLARLSSDGYTLTRRIPRGTGGVTDWFTVSFSVAQA